MHIEHHCQYSHWHTDHIARIMIITQIQQDIAWADPAENRRRSEEQILAAPQSDLYVLPEMWSTGFATEPDGIAEEGDECASLVWMKQMATRTDAAIAGSIAIHASDGTYRNRFYFVKPDGSVTHYDKHHLFTYGNEHHRYTAGEERVIVEWRGMRFLLQICYDLRFPVFARNRGDYDAAIYVASWPTSRIQPWRALLRARAIENQCYVIAVDRVGSDPACDYCGGTELIDAYGSLVSACPDNTVCTITNALDLDALRAFREKFPVLNDAD